MADRKPVSQEPHVKGEYGAQIVAKRTVTVNEGGLLNGAMYDGPEKLEALYRLTTPTLKRLGYDPAQAGTARSNPPRSGGNMPGMLDVKRWLDSLEDTPALEKDIEFLLMIHATVRGRLTDSVTAKIHAAE